MSFISTNSREDLFLYWFVFINRSNLSVQSAVTIIHCLSSEYDDVCSTPTPLHQSEGRSMWGGWGWQCIKIIATVEVWSHNFYHVCRQRWSLSKWTPARFVLTSLAPAAKKLKLDRDQHMASSSQAAILIIKLQRVRIAIACWFQFSPVWITCL